MDYPLFELINARILAAQEAGDFDGLGGPGKPLPEVRDPNKAPINRMINERGRAGICHLVARTGTATGRIASNRRCKIMNEMSMMDAKTDKARKGFG